MNTTTAAPSTSADWTAEWQEVIDAVGRDFLEGETTWGGDPVEGGAIRRYLEPLELDCPLHTDAEAARSAGRDDVTMPATGVIAWTIPAAWRPGEVLFDSDERNAQPVHTAINNQDLGIGPKTTGFFGTDIELDFDREVTVGEHLGRRGKRLVACKPKETGVGRGAFMTWESEIVSRPAGVPDAEPEVVGRIRIGTYAYVPHPKKEEAR